MVIDVSPLPVKTLLLAIQVSPLPVKMLDNNQSPLFVSAQTINDNHSVKSFVWTQTTAVVQVSLLPIKKPPLEQKALRAVCFI